MPAVLVFIYLQLMDKMWDIRRREMHIQYEREKDWKQDFSTHLCGVPSTLSSGSGPDPPSHVFWH
jgi:hypothetical protein